MTSPYPGRTTTRSIAIELIDLGDAEVIEAEFVDDEASMDRYRDAIADIERGCFAPKPDPRRCPGYDIFLVCGG